MLSLVKYNKDIIITSIIRLVDHAYMIGYQCEVTYCH